MLVERVDNVTGSTAGAGSGDFHQYRQLRRKERYRLINMEVEHRRSKEVEEHAARRHDRELECSLKTQKKALKRKGKKDKLKMIKEGLKMVLPKEAPINDGTFLERVRVKYGEDALIKKVESEKSEEEDDDNPLLGKRLIRESSSEGEQEEITIVI